MNKTIFFVKFPVILLYSSPTNKLVDVLCYLVKRRMRIHKVKKRIVRNCYIYMEIDEVV